MTKLYQDLAGSRNNTQGSSARQFVEEARKQGYGMNVRDFFRFAEIAKGRDMGQVVQELRQSGDIDENLYQDLKQKAAGFMGLIKMFQGK